jgi:hypothetical protein
MDLPAMQEWVAEAKAEPDEIDELDELDELVAEF